MSYFFRRIFHLEKANPYHDEIGRFTTADNAVMFVRPKWGYNDNPTKDARWAGAYKEGERFGVRRVPNQQAGEAASSDQIPGRVDLGPLLAANPASPEQASFPRSVMSVAQQMAGMSPASLGAYPNPEVIAHREAREAASPKRDDVHPDYHPVIEKVERFRDHVKALFQDKDRDDLTPAVVRSALVKAGYHPEALGDAGINGSGTFKVTDDAGDTYFVKLNLVDPRQGMGGAVEEERAYRVMLSAGLGEMMNPVYRVHDDLTVQPFFESSGKMSKQIGRDKDSVLKALKDNADGVARLTVAEYLLGDVDKHGGNYNYYNGRIYGTDWSRAGYYGGFCADAFGGLKAAGAAIDGKALLASAHKIMDSIKATGYDKLVATGSGRLRGVEAKSRLDKLTRAVNNGLGKDGKVSAQLIFDSLGWHSYYF